MNDNQIFLQRARAEILELQRRRAVRRKQDRETRSADRVTIELFLDDCIADGLDPENASDLAIIIRAWLIRQGIDPTVLAEWDDDEMSTSHKDLTF